MKASSDFPAGNLSSCNECVSTGWQALRQRAFGRFLAGGILALLCPLAIAGPPYAGAPPYPAYRKAMPATRELPPERKPTGNVIIDDRTGTVRDIVLTDGGAGYTFDPHFVVACIGVPKAKWASGHGKLDPATRSVTAFILDEHGTGYPPRNDLTDLRVDAPTCYAAGGDIDINDAYIDPFPGSGSDGVLAARNMFESRAAAVVRYFGQHTVLVPRGGRWINDDGQATVVSLEPYFPYLEGSSLNSTNLLGANAFFDFYRPSGGQSDISLRMEPAIMGAEPGWCGTDGDYDMNLMYLLPLVYRETGPYTRFTDAAQQRLVDHLIGDAVEHKINLDYPPIGGPVDPYWFSAGYNAVAGKVWIPETENHILMIATAKYLGNQLLYQRHQDPKYDNVRNGNGQVPSCKEFVLDRIQEIFVNECQEYNARPYNDFVIRALLNLSSFAYDDEVRLAARMLLDYFSAKITVSSCDLRRYPPFRRRNEASTLGPLYRFDGQPFKDRFASSGALDWMTGYLITDSPLLDVVGAANRAATPPPPAWFRPDLSGMFWAILAGNTRAFQVGNRHHPYGGQVAGYVDGAPRWFDWSMSGFYSDSLLLAALCDYRLDPVIHDLFVNDSHRRFYQRFSYWASVSIGDDTRRQTTNELSEELYAGSPSYLISAGGVTTTQVYGNDRLGFQLGKVEDWGQAVSSTFMPTVKPKGGATYNAPDPDFYVHGLVQIGGACPAYFWPSSFDVLGNNIPAVASRPPIHARHMGVAPDFMFGSPVYIPPQFRAEIDPRQRWNFINRGRNPGMPGYYLAIYVDDNGNGLLEAFDTWLHPGVSFDDFRRDVLDHNATFQILTSADSSNPVENVYVTRNGDRIHFAMGSLNVSQDETLRAREAHIYPDFADILYIEYGAVIPTIVSPADIRTSAIDGSGQADLHASGPNSLVCRGTVLKSPRPNVIEIDNFFLGKKIVLDLSDKWHPKRTASTGELEEAGSNHQVWVEPDWNGPQEGDFFHPFNSLAAAANAVADGGVVKVMPGTTHEPADLHINKPMRLVAPAAVGTRVGGR